MIENNLVKCFSNSDLRVNLTTILIDMEPWFIAKEVATILGYDDTTRAINRNVDEEDQKLLSCNECKLLFGEVTETIENSDNFRGDINNTPENSIKINNFGMKFINESGLYSLIMSSKKPEARVFKRWVTSEVLPSIRKTGSYNVQKQVPQTYLEALKALVASEEEKEQLKLTNETLTSELTNACEQRDKAIRERGYINDKRTATLMSQEGIRARKINKLENELSDTIEKLTDTTEKLDQAKVELELAKSSMFTNKRVCEMLRDRFEISYADSTLKSKVSKALQSIANEFGENIIYDKQFVDGVLRKVPYYTQRTVDILAQRLEYDCAYLRQF